MYYFAKFTPDRKIDSTAISSCKTETETEFEYYVSKEKYWELTSEMANMILDDEPVQPTYEGLEARVCELEKENASLLFQLLTGEEYTDV